MHADIFGKFDAEQGYGWHVQGANFMAELLRTGATGRKLTTSTTGACVTLVLAQLGQHVQTTATNAANASMVMEKGHQMLCGQ